MSNYPKSISFEHSGGGGKYCNKKRHGEIVYEEDQFGFERNFVQDRENLDLSNNEYIDGLGCVDNKTLNFYALDLETQKVLGEKIGISFENPGPDQPAKIVIVSPDQEIVYEMNSNLKHIENQLSLGQSISTFVNMFHNNPSHLTPLRISKKLNPNRFRSNSHSDNNYDNNCDKYDSISCIKEINGEIFNTFVMEESGNKNVILLYKTAACAFCTAASSAAHVFHTVNRLFR